MIVIDASVAVKWFAAEPESPAAEQLLASGVRLMAPDILYLDVASALTRKARRGDLSAETIQPAMEGLRSIDMQLIPHDALLGTAVALSLQLAHSVADCLYLAAAARHDVALATFDRRLTDLAGRMPDRPVPLWSPA